MRVLNLYAGVGGNRQLWTGDIEVTAVEYNQSVADVYSYLYPHDKVIVADAHEFLVNHYKEFDFIWASPPCQSHSRARFAVASSDNPRENQPPIYPDMKLWQEILFLQHYFKGDWCVENVITFYKPLVQPAFTIEKHHFWSNKFILGTGYRGDRKHTGSISDLQDHKNIDLSHFKFEGIDKRQVLRNMVEPELGLFIFEYLTKGVKNG